MKSKTNTRSAPAKTTVTMRDVAAAARVSLGTVSRVANKHPSVKPLIRARVEAAIAATGWQPNVVAQSMRTASTKAIGCLLPDSRNPLFAAMVKGAEEVARRYGYAFILANSNGEVEHEIELLKLLLQRRVDGLLFAPSDEYDTRMIKLIESTHVPIVLVEREFPEKCDHVVSNQCNGIHQAAEYLLSLGHRRIALITGASSIRPGRERFKGFVQAHEAAGLPIDQKLLRLDSLDAAYGYQEVQSLMSMETPPTAIILGGNMMLAGALRALTLKGVQVPQDVSIIAVGDTDLAELASPPITTVRWDLEHMGRNAAQVLLSRMQGSAVKPSAQTRRITIPTEIVLRRSCRAPRG
jgi:LacI family transcriptional regulator